MILSVCVNEKSINNTRINITSLNSENKAEKFFLFSTNTLSRIIISSDVGCSLSVFKLFIISEYYIFYLK